MKDILKGLAALQEVLEVIGNPEARDVNVAIIICDAEVELKALCKYALKQVSKEI